MKPSTQSKQHMPVIKKAEGKYVWDVDGKKYIDFTGSNLTTILGYRPRESIVPNVPGVSEVEHRLSALLSGYTGTNHFRYFKNGHNAVDCAVRLARHILNKDDAVIVYMGYHGTSDSYIWTTKNRSGIPTQSTWQINDHRSAPHTTDILVFESRYAEYADKIDAKIKIEDCIKEGVRAIITP